MELKLLINENGMIIIRSSNRTFMELKLNKFFAVIHGRLF